jgi:hypothetical protein
MNAITYKSDNGLILNLATYTKGIKKITTLIKFISIVAKKQTDNKNKIISEQAF